MEKSLLSDVTIRSADWYSEDFTYKSVIRFLKENGYKILKENVQKEAERNGRIITASKFFKKELIEVKGFPSYYLHADHQSFPVKSAHAKNWFSEALFNAFLNFSISDHAEVAMALPNVGRYQAIIKNLNEYFSTNDLYFRIYLVNKDGSVEVSNLNYKYASESII